MDQSGRSDAMTSSHFPATATECRPSRSCDNGRNHEPLKHSRAVKARVHASRQAETWTAKLRAALNGIAGSCAHERGQSIAITPNMRNLGRKT